VARNEHALHIALPLGVGKPGLRRGAFDARESGDYRYTSRAGYLTGEAFGLIEAARPSPRPVHGYWDHHVDNFVKRQGRSDHPAERSRERDHAAVFKKVDQFTQPAVVGAVGVSRVKTAGTLATDRAAAGFIERRGVHKGCAAEGAEIFGVERLDAGDTFSANRIASDFGDRAVTKAAVIGENERKKGVRDGSEGPEDRGGQGCRDATNLEGAPQRTRSCG